MLENEKNCVLSLIDAKKSYYIDSNFDWNYVIKMCYKHRLSSILYNKVKDNPAIPNYIMHYLQYEYRTESYQSVKQQKEFLNVLKELKDNGVIIILLKGVYLSAKCYPDLTERPYNDMDILIRKEDANTVFEILRRMGYIQGSYNRYTKRVEAFNANRLIGYEDELQHYGEFVKADDSIFLECFNIDVHHRLNTIFDNFSFDIDELFNRSVKDNIEEAYFNRLGNEDFLLHLASHLYWHTLSIRDIIDERDIRLLMYYDIYLFIMYHPIDWNLLLKKSNQSNLTNALYYTLYHCQLIYGDLIPHAIYESLDEDKMIEISNTIYDRWFTRDIVTPVGKWNEGFMSRIFNEDRKNEALSSLYNDYINQILFQGSYFKVIDINSGDRF